MAERIYVDNIADTLKQEYNLQEEEAKLVIKSIFEVITEALEKDKYVKVKGLGAFKLIDVESRESIDIKTGKRIEIQGHRKITFVPDNTLKELINKPFAHFEAVALSDNTLEGDLKEKSVSELVPLEPKKDCVLEKDKEETTSVGNTIKEIPQLVDEEISNKSILQEMQNEKENDDILCSINLINDANKRTEPLNNFSKIEVDKEKDGRAYFIIIIVLVTLMLLGGLLFLLVPEVIEHILYGNK